MDLRFPGTSWRAATDRCPAAEMGGQTGFQRGGPRARGDRLDVIVADHHVVELDVHRRPLHRVEFLFGLLVERVVLLALPARDVAALPLVLLVRHLPRYVLVHEYLWIGLRHGG